MKNYQSARVINQILREIEAERIVLDVKTDLDVMIVNLEEIEADVKTVLETVTAAVVGINTEIMTGIVLNVITQTLLSAPNVIVVESQEAKVEEEGVEMIVKIFHGVEITVVISTEIMTGIVLNVITRTSLSAPNVIVVENLEEEEDLEAAVMAVEIIPAAEIVVAVIVGTNILTMIGIAPNVRTLTSVSAPNVIAVESLKDKLVQIVLAVEKMISKVEKEQQEMIQNQ